MKTLLAVLVTVLFTSPARASEHFVRLDASSIRSITTSSDCRDSTHAAEKFVGLYSIIVKTNDDQTVVFRKEDEFSSSIERYSTCMEAMRGVARVAASLMATLSSISRNTVQIHQKGEVVYCSTSFIDAVVNEAGETLWFKVLTAAVKCP